MDSNTVHRKHQLSSSSDRKIWKEWMCEWEIPLIRQILVVKYECWHISHFKNSSCCEDTLEKYLTSQKDIRRILLLIHFFEEPSDNE